MTLAVAVLILSPSLAAEKPPQDAVHTYQYTTPQPREKAPNLHPENTSPLYVYGGYGYFGWKMISTSDYISIFTGQESPGLGYSHNADPFIVKRYGAKSNIWIFSVGLDYLSDKLSLPTEYDKNDNLDKTEEDRRAQQLKLLSGLRFGNIMIHGNVLYREFNSTITSHGVRDIYGKVAPLQYYPKSGAPILLNPGDEFSWYTRYTQYEAKLEMMYPFGSMDFGLKIIQFEAPSELRINTGLPDPSMGNVLMYTHNTMYSVFFGFKSLSRIAGNFYLGTYTPVDLGFGGYRAKSDYFEAGSYNPMSFTSILASSVGTFSLQYLRPHVKIEGGLDYGFYYAWANLRDTKLKQDLQFYDDYDNTLKTAKAGESVDLSITRMELFWGLYLSACLYL